MQLERTAHWQNVERIKKKRRPKTLCITSFLIFSYTHLTVREHCLYNYSFWTQKQKNKPTVCRIKTATCIFEVPKLPNKAAVIKSKHGGVPAQAHIVRLRACKAAFFISCTPWHHYSKHEALLTLKKQTVWKPRHLPGAAPVSSLTNFCYFWQIHHSAQLSCFRRSNQSCKHETETSNQSGSPSQWIQPRSQAVLRNSENGVNKRPDDAFLLGSEEAERCLRWVREGCKHLRLPGIWCNIVNTCNKSTRVESCFLR